MHVNSVPTWARPLIQAEGLRGVDQAAGQGLSWGWKEAQCHAPCLADCDSVHAQRGVGHGPDCRPTQER
jgi:hypothetical protein